MFQELLYHYNCKLSGLGSSKATYAISYQEKPLVTPVCSACLQLGGKLG